MTLLTSHLNAIPPTRFIIIEDSVQEQGKNVLHYILESHKTRGSKAIHYFVFENNYRKTKGIWSHKVTYHDFTVHFKELKTGKSIDTFIDELLSVPSGAVIFIDSLAHVIHNFGIAETYRALYKLPSSSTGITQVATVLHTDMLEDPEVVSKYFEQLASLIIVLEGKTTLSSNKRLSYIFKKRGGKVISQVEEYHFRDDGTLITEPIKKLDVQKLVEDGIKTVLPENLSTFKITLSEKDKELRDQLTLPYLPKSETVESSKDGSGGEPREGRIFYNLEDIDDWDEEDPDDDLDI